MKLFICISLCLISQIIWTQETTYTLKELDSITDQNSDKGFKIIENIPVYSGCEKEKGNVKKRVCMSQKIAELFKANFNTQIPEGSELQSGIIRVLVQFKVNKEGRVIDVKTNSKDDYLKSEVVRVAQMMPQFQPETQRGKPVTVPYSLPLNIALDSKPNNTVQFPVYRGCDKSLTYTEMKRCSIEKMRNFIIMSYDYAIADRALPLEKSTKFQLDFIINKKGKVEQVNAKANHRAIAIEAIKVTKRLPRFRIPGSDNGKPINTPVKFTVKIYF